MKNVLIGAAAGIFAVWVKSLVEPGLQLVGELSFPPTEDELEAPGADVTGRPENMPSALMVQSVYEKLTGSSLEYDKVLTYSQALNYVNGAAAGILYAKAYDLTKFSGIGGGIPAGSAYFLANQAVLYPQMGVQEDPQFMPRSWWVWELGSSLVFGAALAGSTKLLSKVFSR